MTPLIIDIYHGNIIADFGAIRDAGVIGIIHKAIQGAYVDPAYKVRRTMAKEAGLLWGAYAFNTGEQISTQVDQFFTAAEPDADTLMALDFEDNPHSQMSLAQCEDFLGRVDDELGRQCWLYSGNRVKDLLGSTPNPFLGSHPLWLAQYGPRAVLQPSWGRYSLWQYSESGRLAGTDGEIDLNTALDVNQLKLEWNGQLPAPAQSTTV